MTRPATSAVDPTLRALLAGILVLGLACGDRGPSASPEAATSDPTPEAAADPDAAAPDAALAAAEALRNADAPPVPPTRYPRGLIQKGPGVAPGYVLFNPILSGTTYLVDEDGAVVHTWESPYSSGGGLYLLPDGLLLRAGRDPGMTKFSSGGTGGILQKIAWDGEVVWEWRLSNAQAVQHHDIEPLPNGNILVLAWEEKPAAEAHAVGRLPELTPAQGLWPDWLLEIEPLPMNGQDAARVVWEWHAWDHLVQDQDPEAQGYGNPAEHPRRIDVNVGREGALPADEIAELQALGYIAPGATSENLHSDFLHTNAVDYNPQLDQIALSVPALNEVWIIDHSLGTEEARGPRGDLLYRWGNPAAYGRGRAGDRRLFYQHDVQWIPVGFQGAGNLTVYNNGLERPEGPWSSIDEWTPPLDGDGRYVLADGSGYGPSTLAWRYVGTPATDFYSPFISGASRLANGNTLVCEGTGGRLLEVTRSGEVVWEYRNPFSGSVTNEDGSAPQPGLEQSPYAVFRATHIPRDHPALAGRSLSALVPAPAWFDSGAAQAQ